MPYKSSKQRSFMRAQKPRIAKRWERKYGSKIASRGKAKTRKNPYRALD